MVILSPFPLKDNINLLAKLDITAKIELVIQGGGSATTYNAGSITHFTSANDTAHAAQSAHIGAASKACTSGLSRTSGTGLKPARVGMIYRAKRQRELGCGFTLFGWYGDKLARESPPPQDVGDTGRTVHYLYVPDSSVPAALRLRLRVISLQTQPDESLSFVRQA